MLASASPGDPRVATPAVGLGWNCSIRTPYSRGLLFPDDLLALAHKVGCQPNEVFECSGGISSRFWVVRRRLSRSPRGPSNRSPR